MSPPRPERGREVDGFDRARLDRLHGAGAMPAVIQDVSTGVYAALDD